MIPRTKHRDFNIQLQVNENKRLPQILHSSFQEKTTKSLTLKPGYEYKIEISMDGQIGTNGFQDLPLIQRNCRLNHEINKDSIFKVYSKSNCMYECYVKKAYESCQCVPWDFLHNNANASECDIFGRTCFYSQMKKLAKVFVNFFHTYK